jgi:hypothetical protein
MYSACSAFHRFVVRFSSRPPSLAVLLAASLFLSACATESYEPSAAPEYMSTRDFSPFYRFGPQQGGGPDATLRAGTRFKLLRREMGFSYVQLDDSRTGYVANENMAVAPPRPPEAKRQEESSAATGSRKRGARGAESPVYSGPAVNDTPLPDPNTPPPDLNIEPEIVPDTIPVPSSTPAGTPKFRY